MIREESNKKLDKVIASLKKGFDPEAIGKALMEIREDALKDEDPLLAKVLRLTAEYLKEEGCFDHTVEKVEVEVKEGEEGEEEEEKLAEPGTDVENLTYFLELLKRSENKYNREEIKEMRTFLKQKLY